MIKYKEYQRCQKKVNFNLCTNWRKFSFVLYIYDQVERDNLQTFPKGLILSEVERGAPKKEITFLYIY